MKKILSIITVISLITPIFQNTYAGDYSPGYIDTLLNLNTGIEEFDIELMKIEDVYFTNLNTQNIFNAFKKINKILKDEIIKKYKNGDFDYYQTKGIIKNQKMFVYYINRYFYYLSFKEKNPNYVETDNFILKNYSKARIYYRKVRYLINK